MLRTRVTEGKTYKVTFQVRNGMLYADGTWPTNAREAMKVTLVKWTFLLELAKERQWVLSGGGETCGLCRMFIQKDRSCQKCPVMQATGLPECRGTAYHRYVNALSVDDAEGARIEAEAEVEFLAGLEV